MRQKLWRCCVVFLFLASLFTMGSATASAHSHLALATSHMSVAAKGGCAHYQVYLHGNQSPNVKCLDIQQPSTHPHGIKPVGCDAHSLILWSDASFSGYTICFKGAGATDLTSYCLPWYDGGCLYSWNDWASSYAPGCSSGRLYYDIGERNVLVSFGSNGSRGNLSGSQNDAASSVRLDSNCS